LEARGWGWGLGEGGSKIQSLYAHMNKGNKKKRKYPSQKGLEEWLKVKALSSSPSTIKKVIHVIKI
jgi:hypothetical protein